MAATKGPAVLLALFVRDVPPLNTLDNICKWFADLRCAGVQILGWDRDVIDIDQALTSNTSCNELKRNLAGFGRSIKEVAAYVGQLLAIHPTYEAGFAGLHPSGLQGTARTEWAASEVPKYIEASAKLRLRGVAFLSGGFAWHLIYPWPDVGAWIEFETEHAAASRA